MARTVLLADDSVTAQNMGRRILIDAGYEVVTVNNGSAALKRVHESPPDLIVLDVYMPGYGGLEVCQRLKESDDTAKIPILLTVGKMEPFKADEAKRVRADGHIIKPFEASELLAALTRLEDRIIPRAEPSRGRKPKSEKKTKPSRAAFDPAMSFDDVHTDKIAYLEQVKQKHASVERPEETQESLAEVESARAHSAAPAETAKAPVSEGPSMPRPMSVYAAEALRELPLVMEPPLPVASEEQYQEAPVVPPAAVTEEISTSASAPSVVAESQPNEATEISAEVVQEPVPELRTVEESKIAEEVTTASSSELPQSDEAAPSVESSASESVPTTEPAAKSRWVAENVAVSAEEAALELEREMQHTQAIAELAPSAAEMHDQATDDNSSHESAAEFVQRTSETASMPLPEHSQTDGATFAAAAAAAGSTSDAVSSVSALSSPDSEPPVASEAAAAWQNWQHIRDSVMGSQTAVQLSESVAEVVQASSAPVTHNEAASPHAHETVQTAESATAQAAESDDAISSIVDSVLAELKPKLMAEISKKLKK